MPSSEIPDAFRDLLFANIASLTTIGSDGGPQATLVWFAFDEADQKLKLSLSSDRAKTRNLRARPQVSLLIPDAQNPQRYMDVRGLASTEPDPDAAWAVVHVNPKYSADVRNFPGADRVVVTIEPTHVYTVDLSR